MSMKNGRAALDLFLGLTGDNWAEGIVIYYCGVMSAHHLKEEKKRQTFLD